ncbi:hypothetical protein [Xanthomarina gelatinilytica]|uniref:hypothetical protein n=1 Tax=Xanthomarina gelatinilytica TaxID=1137281 RepID=UPI003AA8C623
MNSTVKNILAVIAGLVIGSIVNMGLITISGSIIPPPEGVDNSTMEGLNESMHLFQPKHFIFPFLAHALGTLVGAFIASKIATSRKMTFAMVIGVFFLIGGITSVMMLPSPTWFSILDIVVAYIPMAWIGGKLAIK